MTARQIEQVTPRSHPTDINQPSRTWKQPKIRVHNPVRSTPPTVADALQVRPRHFRTTRVRVTRPSDNLAYPDASLLKTTPVTHPTLPKPLKFRIAGAQPEANSLRRRLFPNSTPAKRTHHATASFRFSCGRERTQPSAHRSRSHLLDALDAQVDEAQRNLRIFRNGLSSLCTDSSFQTAIREGILLEVTCRQDNLLVLKPYAQHSDEQSIQVAVVVTDEMLSEQMIDTNQVDYSGHIVYIPNPWHAQPVDQFNFRSLRIRMLIAAHKVDVFRKERLERLANLGINSALDPLLFHKANIPGGQEADSSRAGLGFRFAALSPHMIVTNLSVFVDFYDPSYELAVIRDDAGELAVLITRCAELEASSRKVVLNNVSILPYRVLAHVILEVVGDRRDEGLHNRIATSANSYIAFKHVENLERRGF